MELIKNEIKYKNSKIKILTDNDVRIRIAEKEIIKQYDNIEDYIKENPDFLSSLSPIKIKKNAPKAVKLMAEGAKIANVGPMAAVAGTIAELACRKIMGNSEVIIVENGGDIFLSTKKPIVIGIYAGYNKTADKLAFRIGPSTLSLCSSSSKMGHSLSFGDCDLVTVFSKRGNIADAAATAVCNKIKKTRDIENAIKWGIGLTGVDGILAIKDDKIGLIGDLPEMIKNKDKLLKDKITKDEIWVLN